MTYNKNKNYCTLSPDSLFGINFNYACYLHDLQYDNEAEVIHTKLVADLCLWKNIILECWKVNKLSITWSWFVGMIYFIAVRIFGRKQLKK